MATTQAVAPSPPGAVLYVDHARHLTPLTLCYHATASRHLTSGRPDVVPPSTTAEVDSAHCPRCLKFCDAASAAAGVCQRDDGGCKDCPVCFSPASVSIDENNAEDAADGGRLVCHYLCGHCKWSSRECGVTSNADRLLGMDGDGEEAEKQRGAIISEVAKKLENCFKQRVKERGGEGDSLFQSIASMWTQREQEEQRRKRMLIGVTPPKKGGADTGGQTWSLQTLEQTLEAKKKDLASPYTQSAALNVSEGDTSKSDIPTKKQALPTPQQMAAQMTLITQTPQSRPDLLPLPVPYRARVSRRCRAELAAGRPGILVKPKLNPLEGDTSLRAGHGQWWKKDSSAVHVVPRVQVCRRRGGATGRKHAALLRVKNPTLNPVRLRLSGPSEGGSAAVSPTIDISELDNILVDPFMETFVRAELCPPEAIATLASSEFFVLEPADDPFLDIGKGQSVDPSDVRGWDAASVLDALGDGNASHLRLVAAQGDTAWVELVLCNASSTKTSDSKYLAVPLALQIEVGNGSWEASLIKRRDIPKEEKDMVTLSLVTLL